MNNHSDYSTKLDAIIERILALRTAPRKELVAVRNPKGGYRMVLRDVKRTGTL